MAQTILLQQLREIIKEELLGHTTETAETGILLTRSEACDLLKADSSTLWHWIKKGKLKAYGIGHRRYYTNRR